VHQFVAVLSSQPQGGFITRKPAPVIEVADRNGDDFLGFFFAAQSGTATWNARRRGGQPILRGNRAFGKTRQGNATHGKLDIRAL